MKRSILKHYRNELLVSGADIESIMNDAAILAVRSKSKAINIHHVDEAIDRHIAGPARSGVVMNESERKRVAYHEAGHAIGLKINTLTRFKNHDYSSWTNRWSRLNDSRGRSIPPY